VPFLTINTFISRVINAEKKVSRSFYFQFGFNLSLLILLILITPYYGEYGFIFTMLIAYFLYITLVSIFLFKWIMPFIIYRDVLKSFGVIFLFNIPLILIYYKIFGTLTSVIQLILIACSYYLLIIILNHFIKINSSTHFHLSNFLKFIYLKVK